MPMDRRGGAGRFIAGRQHRRTKKKDACSPIWVQASFSHRLRGPLGMRFDVVSSSLAGRYRSQRFSTSANYTDNRGAHNAGAVTDVTVARRTWTRSPERRRIGDGRSTVRARDAIRGG
jgi:hypothetical protein